jgi:predicted metal-binding protein
LHFVPFENILFSPFLIKGIGEDHEGNGSVEILGPVVEGKPAEAKVIHPKTVVTAPWVRMKCRFGCRGYGRSYCCPPETPAAEETWAMLDCYQRAILFHFTLEKNEREVRKKALREFFDALIALEGALFKDAFYKAFVFLAGPCDLCDECGKLKGTARLFKAKARPAMEACGIDVYQTAWNNGFPIWPLREKSETQNDY